MGIKEGFRVFRESARSQRLHDISGRKTVSYRQAQTLVKAPLIMSNEPLSKFLVSPLITPIVVPYISPYITPLKEFRL